MTMLPPPANFTLGQVPNPDQKTIQSRNQFRLTGHLQCYPSMDDLLANSETTKKTTQTNNDIPILLSNDDEGVVRNNGRRGSAFGPEAILNNLKTFITPENFNSCLKSTSISPVKQVSQSYDQRQWISCLEWQKLWQSLGGEGIFKSQNPGKLIIHLAAGHDHIYPLLWSIHPLSKNFKSSGPLKLDIVNLDAHTDTRTDSWSHSGTPFRQWNKFLEQAKPPIQCRLLQYGIHRYANPQDNYSQLEKTSFQVIHNQETQLFPHAIKNHFLNSDIAILSLDADAISGHEMTAVSAVNPHGLARESVVKAVMDFMTSAAKIKIFGIYEYNPVFEKLGGPDLRFLASLCYQVLAKKNSGPLL